MSGLRNVRISKFICKTHQGFKRYRADTKVWRTDRQMDRRTDRQTYNGAKTICLPISWGETKLLTFMTVALLIYRAMFSRNKPGNKLILFYKYVVNLIRDIFIVKLIRGNNFGLKSQIGWIQQYAHLSGMKISTKNHWKLATFSRKSPQMNITRQ